MKNLFVTIVALFALNTHALTVDEISFDDKITVDSKELVLNGVGIRKATFLRIKVYYGALYLSQKTKNASDFLTNSEPKQITMHFVRDVDAKDLKKTYKEAFVGANKDTHQSMSATFESLNNNFDDVKKGERIIFTFHTDGVTLTTPKKSFPKVGDQNFARAILNMWFINPLDENLSKGLLNQ